MTLTVPDIIGSVGVVLIILTYLLIQLQRLSSLSLWYSVLNGAGALLIMVSLYFSFNLSAFLIEFFWLLISLIGIGRNLLERNKTRDYRH